jgi:high-affinity nickel-transport protein
VKTLRRVRREGRYQPEDLDTLLAGGGLLARLLRPLFASIRTSWHMYPLGLLFGLGFDTASEIGLLGISATEAAHGLGVWNILVFPALFTAGMSLLDTTDSVLMVGAYGWAFRSPLRKLHYNITLTFVSVLAAVLVGGIEALGLVGRKLGGEGAFWRAIAGLNDHFGAVGYLIVGVFALCWIASMVYLRLRGEGEPAALHL